MRSESVRLLKTIEHGCGYFPERLAQNLVLDPLSPALPTLYPTALARGFRRAGGHVYRPDCARCHACVACRIPVAAFRASRSQRRCQRDNGDLEVSIELPSAGEEVLSLYRRYLAARHPDGGMDGEDAGEFRQFAASTWSPTRFLCVRADGRLLAVAITDMLAIGYSAVYTFFEPDLAGRGLGTFAILAQIDVARAANVPYLYLGYWISQHPKMTYKTRFRPFELLVAGDWRPCGHLRD